MTIQASHELPVDNAEAVETWIFETCHPAWSLMRKKATDPCYLLQGFFVSMQEAQDEASKLTQSLDSISFSWTFTKIEDQDWQNAYKQYLKPWSSGNLHWIPVWEKESYSLPSGHHALYLDAGMAFGTGAHETTRLCAKRLIDFAEDHNPEEHKLIDAGCGSGILALSASLMGFKELEAFDIDEPSIGVARENAQDNKLENKINFFCADLENGLKDKQASLILANLQSHILIPAKKSLLQAMPTKKGVLILSGILNEELANVESEFMSAAQDLGLQLEADSRSLGQWSDLRLRAKG